METSPADPSIERRRRVVRSFLALSLIGGLAALGAATMANFNATIVNTSNTFQSGTIALKETSGATTCLSTGAGVTTDTNSFNCSTIDKFGGAGSPNQKPGGTALSTVVTVKNDGTINAGTFTVTPGSCTASQTGVYHGSNTAGFCAKINVTVEDDTGAATCVFPAGAGACAAPFSSNTLASLVSGGAISLNSGSLAAGASRTYTFKVQLDGSAGNDMQGLTASLPLTWYIAQ
jgi:hypothetical protein